MPRWIVLVVLLFALPVQFAAATLAGYCAHEAAPTQFHLGHHVHDHWAGGDEAIDQAHAAVDGGPSPMGHGDCSGCHASAAQLGAAQPSPSAREAHRSFAAMSRSFFGTRAEQDIDRPKWSRTG